MSRRKNQPRKNKGRHIEMIEAVQRYRRGLTPNDPNGRNGIKAHNAARNNPAGATAAASAA